MGVGAELGRDLSIGSRMINARRETLREKKSFIGPLSKRRCLIVADGYYEWQQRDGVAKQPFWIAPSARRPAAVGRFVGSQQTSHWCTDRDVYHHYDRSQCQRERYPRSDACCTLQRRGRDGGCLPSATQRKPIDCSSPPLRWPNCNRRAVSTYVNNARHEGPQCLADGTGRLLPDHS